MKAKGEVEIVKILILSNNDIGLWKFRKELIERLIKEHEVYVSIPQGEFSENFKKMGCKVIETSINRRGTNPIKDLGLFVKYNQLLKKVKPDLVLTYTIKPNVYGGMACRLNKIPYISNVTGLGTAVETKGLIQNLTVFLYKVGLKKASCVFFQNKSNKSFFEEKKIILKNSKVIPGSGVNLDYFRLIEYPSSDKIKFLFIGRVMKEKGIEQYLEAATYIKKKYPHTEFHILGTCDEKYEEKLESMSKKGIISYHGRQDDVRKYHEISHCTIHPSYYPEGMSNVLLESAASGRPLITTNRPGCKETVNDGINGYLFQEKNSQDLIKKVENFINIEPNARRNMGLFGREKVEKEFDRNIVIDAYITEINKFEVC